MANTFFVYFENELISVNCSRRRMYADDLMHKVVPGVIKKLCIKLDGKLLKRSDVVKSNIKYTIEPRKKRHSIIEKEISKIENDRYIRED